MDPTETTPAPLPADSAFTTQLGAAFRGGVIMLASSVLWGRFLQLTGGSAFEACFMWLSSAWLIFPVGAFLGCSLPRWAGTRGWVAAVGIGLLVGMLASLALTAAFWLMMNHNDLIGLVLNRRSGGYASYSYSVRLQLREQAWRALHSVAPVTAVWVTLWTVWTNRSGRIFPSAPTHQDSLPIVRLRLDHHLLRLVGWIAVGFALFTTAVLLLSSLMVKGGQVPLRSFFLLGPGAAALVVLGPFLGPSITSWSFDWAWKYAAVGLPVLLGSLAPFGLRRRPVRPGTAVVAWCGFVTALFFWVALGLFSLSRCVG